MNAMDDAELKRLLETNAAETREHFDDAVAKMEGRIDSAAVETRQRFDAMEKHVDSTAAENRRHFDVTADGLRHDFRLVVEKVISIDEKLEREAADIRDEMRKGFADTQAMIKFSHGELHRRVSTLEDGYADLRARVERLESSTH